MKKKLFSILSALLVAILVTTTAGAGAIKLTKVSFSLSTSSGGTSVSALRNTESFGSLVANGYASGLGNLAVKVKLDADGNAETICTNNGENDVPGRSYPKVSAVGEQTLYGNDLTRKNGKSPFEAATVNPETIAWDVAGCPNSNWTARISFIEWTHATVVAVDPQTGANLSDPQEFDCTTTRNPDDVTCSRVN